MIRRTNTTHVNHFLGMRKSSQRFEYYLTPEGDLNFSEKFIFLIEAPNKYDKRLFRITRASLTNLKYVK